MSDESFHEEEEKVVIEESTTQNNQPKRLNDIFKRDKPLYNKNRQGGNNNRDNNRRNRENNYDRETGGKPTFVNSNGRKPNEFSNNRTYNNPKVEHDSRFDEKPFFKGPDREINELMRRNYTNDHKTNEKHDFKQSYKGPSREHNNGKQTIEVDPKFAANFDEKPVFFNTVNKEECKVNSLPPKNKLLTYESDEEIKENKKERIAPVKREVDFEKPTFTNSAKPTNETVNTKIESSYEKIRNKENYTDSNRKNGNNRRNDKKIRNDKHDSTKHHIQYLIEVKFDRQDEIIESPAVSECKKAVVSIEKSSHNSLKDIISGTNTEKK